MKLMQMAFLKANFACGLYSTGQPNSSNDEINVRAF